MYPYLDAIIHLNHREYSFLTFSDTFTPYDLITTTQITKLSLTNLYILATTTFQHASCKIIQQREGYDPRRFSRIWLLNCHKRQRRASIKNIIMILFIKRTIYTRFSSNVLHRVHETV